MRLRIRQMVWMLLFLSSTIPIYGQSSGDGYNPDNPIEPSNPGALVNYNVQAYADKDGAGTITGTGKYPVGTRVTLKATANTGYKFMYWQKDDSPEPYSQSQSFVYEMTEADVRFVAVFEKLKYVEVRTADSNAGKAYGSGYYSYGAVATIRSTANENYTFSHWTKDNSDAAYSTDASFTYEVGEENVVFTAIFDYTPPPYTPESPDEPTDLEIKSKHSLKVSLSDEGAGVVSGAGRYLYGTNVTVSTSPNAGYRFLYWLKDGGGTPYKTTASFTYTMGIEDVSFVAVYEELPPVIVPDSHKLNLVPSTQGCCTFSIPSGTSIQEGDAFSVTVIPGMEHEFEGWYQNGTLVATTLTYGSYMGAEDITLVARCKYVPENPDEPNNPGGFIPEVDVPGLLGDVNGDGVVNTTDAVLVINYYLGKSHTIDFNAADMNNDGIVNTTDAVLIINKYLNK